jgi:hypothetical protein
MAGTFASLWMQNMFFIRDASFCEDESDDPRDAIVTFLAPAQPDDEALVLITGHLTGLVESAHRIYPASDVRIVQLGATKAALKVISQYVVCLGGPLHEPSRSLSHHLDLLVETFVFFHGSFDALKASVGGNRKRFASTMTHLWSGILFHFRPSGSLLCSAFTTLPDYSHPKGSNRHILQASQLLRRVKALAGAPGCVIHRQSIVFTTLPLNESLSSLFIVQPTRATSHVEEEYRRLQRRGALIRAAMKELDEPLIRTQIVRVNPYPDCFVASALVAFLISSGEAPDKWGAVALGQAFLQAGVINTVAGTYDFRDDNKIYRFRADDPDTSMSADQQGNSRPKMLLPGGLRLHGHGRDARSQPLMQGLDLPDNVYLLPAYIPETAEAKATAAVAGRTGGGGGGEEEGGTVAGVSQVLEMDTSAAAASTAEDLGKGSSGISTGSDGGPTVFGSPPSAATIGADLFGTPPNKPSFASPIMRTALPVKAGFTLTPSSTFVAGAAAGSTMRRGGSSGNSEDTKAPSSSKSSPALFRNTALLLSSSLSDAQAPQLQLPDLNISAVSNELSFLQQSTTTGSGARPSLQPPLIEVPGRSAVILYVQGVGDTSVTLLLKKDDYNKDLLHHLAMLLQPALEDLEQKIASARDNHDVPPTPEAVANCNYLKFPHAMAPLSGWCNRRWNVSEQWLRMLADSDESVMFTRAVADMHAEFERLPKDTTSEVILRRGFSTSAVFGQHLFGIETYVQPRATAPSQTSLSTAHRPFDEHLSSLHAAVQAILQIDARGAYI